MQHRRRQRIPIVITYSALCVLGEIIYWLKASPPIRLLTRGALISVEKMLPRSDRLSHKEISTPKHIVYLFTRRRRLFTVARAKNISRTIPQNGANKHRKLISRDANLWNSSMQTRISNLGNVLASDFPTVTLLLFSRIYLIQTVAKRTSFSHSGHEEFVNTASKMIFSV